MAPPMPDALTLVSLETDLMGCWHSPPTRGTGWRHPQRRLLLNKSGGMVPAT
jgi:hypothetical protein